MKCSNSKTRSVAFTLLEIIVAITLMDLIALSLYSSLYIATKAKRSASEAIRPYQSLGNVFDSLRYDLQASMVPNGVLAGGFYGEDLSAGENQDADILQFCCASYSPKEDEKSSNIIQAAYELTIDEQYQENVLVRKTTINLLSSKTADISHEEIVARGINSLNFRYFDGYSWLDTWDSTTMENQLPVAVEVTVKLRFEPDTQVNRNSNVIQQQEFISRRIFLLSCAQSPLAVESL